MKKIGIISDTHGLVDARYAHHFADCDEVWHAGDIGSYDVIEAPRAIRPGITVRAVAGNIDGADIRREFGEIQCFTVEGVKVWMTHICGYPGKYSPGVRPYLRNEKPQLTVGGHSHILRVMYDNEFSTLYVNPGAAGYQGWQKVRTLVRLVLDAGQIKDLEVIELAKS